MNNDDDSAMTYVILGTHLCHALALELALDAWTKSLTLAIPFKPFKKEL